MLSLIACAWIVGVFFALPISADRYRASLPVKVAVTIGHLLAMGVLLYPFRYKGVVRWVGGFLASAFALLQVLVLLIWN